MNICLIRHKYDNGCCSSVQHPDTDFDILSDDFNAVQVPDSFNTNTSTAIQSLVTKVPQSSLNLKKFSTSKTKNNLTPHNFIGILSKEY